MSPSPMESDAGGQRPRGADDPREISGWIMCDWANSAFSTTVATALFGPYVTAIAQGAVGENGIVLSLGPFGAVTAKSLFPYTVSLSVFLQIFLLPFLGAVADFTRLKKKLMAAACTAGAAATSLLFLTAGSRYLLGAALFMAANLCFGLSIVLYNAFLPEICSEGRRDAVSSRGFAMGYLGGGLLLGVNFALILGADRLGISKSLAVRLSLLSAGLWWGGFSALALTRLKTRAPANPLPAGRGFLSTGVSQLKGTFRELARLPRTLRYLVAYLFYNDGVQTVISMATVFLEQELFISKGLGPQPGFLLGLLLMVQFVAFAGALLFERIARVMGTKRTILLSLVLWSGVILYAYARLRTVADAWLLGAMIALVLGGSQALSRSLFSRMIPRGREAAFFGFYEISERGTSWAGPLIFGLVVGCTGSYRQALLSLMALFVVGAFLLATTDTDRAVRDAARAPAG